jgi:GntR family transcriptional regulator
MNHTKSLPLYVQIAEGLIERIESGDLLAGERLPPERELSKSLSVTRATLRQALQLLESEGLLVRRQGSGTYIAEPKIERSTAKLNPFTTGMRKSGYKPGASVISFEQRLAKVSIASRLSLPVSTPLYYCHRVRSLNGEPTMLEKFYLPASFFPDLSEEMLQDASVFEVLEKTYSVRVVRAEQSLEAVVASEYEAGLLEVDKGAPLLLERRVAFDQNDRPVEYAKDLYRGDRFRFVMSSELA